MSNNLDPLDIVELPKLPVSHNRFSKASCLSRISIHGWNVQLQVRQSRFHQPPSEQCRQSKRKRYTDVLWTRRDFEKLWCGRTSQQLLQNAFCFCDKGA